MKYKPKILHLLPWDFAMGGAQRFIVDLANWASEFAEIHILCKSHNHFWKVNAEIHDIENDLDGESLIKDLDPDLIHHHYPLHGWLMNVVSQYPHVGTCHGYLDTMNIPENDNWIIPICGSFKNKIIHGIDITKFTPRVYTHNKNDNVIIGLIARRSGEKIPPCFIEYLQKNGLPKNMTLRVIGNGGRITSKEITEQLSKIANVELIGDLPINELPEQYAQIDILLIPSLKESCSYVALEAMASGIPIVYRNVEALNDIIQYAGLSGNTDEELFIQIKQLAKNPELRNVMGQAGRKLAETRYNINRMFKEYNDIYRKFSNGIVRCPQRELDCSVVIPVYNTPPKFLLPSILSVIQQEGVNFEIIVVNDESTNEDTLTALNLYSNKIRIINREHTEIIGCGPAINDGIKAANSDLIIRHDSDDIMLPGRLSTQVNFHREHPSVGVTAGQLHMINNEGIRESWSGCQYKTYDKTKPYWLQDWNTNGIAHPTVAFKRHLVLKMGGYIPGFCQDFDLWSRMWLNNVETVILPNYFTEYRWSYKGQESKHDNTKIRRQEIIEKYNAILFYIKSQCKSLKPFMDRYK
jgi:glycosyltransferase involved in cell wall biosynthesis